MNLNFQPTANSNKTILFKIICVSIDERNEKSLHIYFEQILNIGLNYPEYNDEAIHLISTLLKSIQIYQWIPEKTMTLLMNYLNKDVLEKLINICIHTQHRFLIKLVEHVLSQYPELIDDMQLYKKLVRHPHLPSYLLKPILPTEYVYQSNRHTLTINTSLHNNSTNMNCTDIMEQVTKMYPIAQKTRVGHGGYGIVYNFTICIEDGTFLSLMCKEIQESSSMEVKPNEIKILDEMFQKGLFANKGFVETYGYMFDIISKKWRVFMKPYDNFENQSSMSLRPITVLELLKNVRELHKHGIAHNDIDKSNILYDNRLVLCDFGISRPNRLQKLTNNLPRRERNRVPECKTGHIVDTHLMDVYQLGVLLSTLNIDVNNQEETLFSKNKFRKLVNNMKTTDPNDRISLEDAIIAFKNIFNLNEYDLCKNLLNKRGRDEDEDENEKRFKKKCFEHFEKV